MSVYLFFCLATISNFGFYSEQLGSREAKANEFESSFNRSFEVIAVAFGDFVELVMTANINKF